MRKLLAGLLFAAFSVSAFGHGNNSHFPQQQDVQYKTTKISGNVYMLQGRGGNIGAITGPDGILIVDDDYRGMSQKFAAALKELGQENRGSF